MTNQMHRRASLAVVGLVLAGFAAASPNVGAVESSQRIQLTFSKPISLPGVTLPAGTYLFERALPDSAVEIVRVSSQDRRFVYFTGYTQLVERPGRNAPRITFGEAVAGAPAPIKEWYPSFTSSGHRFLYR